MYVLTTCMTVLVRLKLISTQKQRSRAKQSLYHRTILLFSTIKNYHGIQLICSLRLPRCHLMSKLCRRTRWNESWYLAVYGTIFDQKTNQMMGFEHSFEIPTRTWPAQEAEDQHDRKSQHMFELEMVQLRGWSPPSLHSLNLQLYIKIIMALLNSYPNNIIINESVGLIILTKRLTSRHCWKDGR